MFLGTFAHLNQEAKKPRRGLTTISKACATPSTFSRNIYPTLQVTKTLSDYRSPRKNLFKTLAKRELKISGVVDGLS